MIFGRYNHSPVGKKNYLVVVLLSVLLLLVGIAVSLRVNRLHQSWSVQDATQNKRLRILYPFDKSLITAAAATKRLVTDEQDIFSTERLFSFLLNPLQANDSPLLCLVENKFPIQSNLLHEMASFSGDIKSLLGFDKPQTYLIVLQNRAERRPNGGFFWSFALVTIDHAELSSFEVSDSYLPAYNTPGTKILWPTRLEQFLPDRDIYFVGANKVWFTYQDGAHIKTLYEKSYPWKTVRGVIFLRTDMFEQLLPEFTQQLWHRQYVNASIDLLRGESKRWKKQVYLSSLEEFLQQHKQALLSNFIKQLPSLVEARLINIYLEDISGWLHTRLRKSYLTTRFEEDHAYFRDSNISFNKSDRFVAKSINLYDADNVKLHARTSDIIQLPTLPAWNYLFEITYKLAVPEIYHKFIRTLNNEYGITLTSREEHILTLDSTWASRGVVYFPTWIQPQTASGNIDETELFETPFSHSVMYTTQIDGNDKSVVITIPIKVDPEKK